MDSETHQEYTPRKRLLEKRYSSQSPGSVQGAKITVFASGKGGVGKTALSVHLASMAASFGKQAVLIDADLGTANGHILLGMPHHSQYASDGSSNLELLQTCFPGFFFSPGVFGHAFEQNEVALRNQKILEFASRLKQEGKYVFIDAGAGIQSDVTALFRGADQLILVTQGTPTALLDAYSLLKVTLPALPDLSCKVIVNQCMSKAHAEQVFYQLNYCSEKFLKKPLIYLGGIKKDSSFDRALTLQRPMTNWDQKPPVFVQLYKIAGQIFLGDAHE